MLFNSIGFLIFLVIMLFIYYLCPQKYRHFVLLLGSYVFYMCWNAYLVFLILFTTLVSYGGALLIKKTSKEGIKKLFLIISITMCLGVLVFFKYINFIIFLVPFFNFGFATFNQFISFIPNSIVIFSTNGIF